MKNNEADIFVFIGCIVIGILIALNINFDRQNKRVFLNAKQYQEAYNTRTKLIKDISLLEEQYDYFFDKLYKYESNKSSDYHIFNEINDELQSNKIAMGSVPVEGQGIEITLNDADLGFTDDYYLTREKLVHDFDISRVINDVKNAGSEAISINGQRIINTSEIYCGGPFVYVNGVKITAPFYISAIGDKGSLKSFMLLNENYLKYLMVVRQLHVEINEADNIKIPAFEGDIRHEFLSQKK